MVEWLNTNQGFVMSVLTFVYVVATITIVMYNSKMIKESKLTRENESRPYVFAYLEKDPRDQWFQLKIKNHGKQGAIINKFSINPLPRFYNNMDPANVLEDTIIAPNQMLQLFLLENSDETFEKDYIIKLEYSTIEKKDVYSENYKLKVKYKVLMGFSESNTSSLNSTENSLKNISNSLDSIRNKM